MAKRGLIGKSIFFSLTLIVLLSLIAVNVSATYFLSDPSNDESREIPDVYKPYAGQFDILSAEVIYTGKDKPTEVILVMRSNIQYPPNRDTVFVYAATMRYKDIYGRESLRGRSIYLYSDGRASGAEKITIERNVIRFQYTIRDHELIGWKKVDATISDNNIRRTYWIDEAFAEAQQTCGNNRREGLEVCDGTDLAGNSCMSFGFSEGTLRCRADCSNFDTSLCRGQAPVCGNNRREGLEVCDGTDLAGNSCMSFGFSEGTLRCRADCSNFDTSLCRGQAPVCGNNRREGLEVCDGTDLAGNSCMSFGFSEGTLRCRADCSNFDTSLCRGQAPVCGNNRREGLEVCDGTDLAGNSCMSFGFSEGTLRCRADCSNFDTSLCRGQAPVCGNNRREGLEVCDGTDLAGNSCMSFGFSEGTLRCVQDCSAIDKSQCRNSLNEIVYKDLIGDAQYDRGENDIKKIILRPEGNNKYRVIFELVGEGGKINKPPQNGYYRYEIPVIKDKLRYHHGVFYYWDGRVECTSGCSEPKIDGTKVSFVINLPIPKAGTEFEGRTGFSRMGYGPTDYIDFVYGKIPGNSPVCGNGIIEGTERCDMFALDDNEKGCRQEGFGDGLVRCGPDCQSLKYNSCSGYSEFDVELRPVSNGPPVVGVPYPVDLVVKRWHNKGHNVGYFSMITAFLSWDPDKIYLNPILDQSRSPYNWFSSVRGFFPDRGLCGLNNDLSDGNGFLVFARDIFGPFPLATEEGLIVTTIWVTPKQQGESTLGIHTKYPDSFPPCDNDKKDYGLGVYCDEVPGLKMHREYRSLKLVARQGEKRVFCGNGIREPENGEECDGSDLGEKRCPNFGNPRFSGGIIRCNSNCKYDTKECLYGDRKYSKYLCGDVAIDYQYGLVCETGGKGDTNPDNDLLGQMAPPEFGCKVFGFRGGKLKCSLDCASFDTSGCFR